MKFEERIKEIQEEFDKKIKELKEEFKNEQEENNTSFPNVGDKYFVVYADGTILDSHWRDDVIDRCRLSIGNVFKTKKEAEFKVERLEVLTEMKKYSKPFDFDENNYFIYYEPHQIKVDECDIQTNDIFFKSEEMARKAINEIGEERIKKYYLCID